MSKGGKSQKRTTSRGRKVKRARNGFRWPLLSVADVARQLRHDRDGQEEPRP